MTSVRGHGRAYLQLVATMLFWGGTLVISGVLLTQRATPRLKEACA